MALEGPDWPFIWHGLLASECVSSLECRVFRDHGLPMHRLIAVSGLCSGRQTRWGIFSASAACIRTKCSKSVLLWELLPNGVYGCSLCNIDPHMYVISIYIYIYMYIYI